MEANLEQENKFEYFNRNFRHIENWLEQNIYVKADQVVNKLFEKEVITWNDVENLYPVINESNYDDYDQYQYDIDNNTPNEIYEWYIVSETAFNKFKSWGHPVLQFEELYFWGRTFFGQAIVVDFYYQSDKIKEIVPQNQTFNL